MDHSFSLSTLICNENALHFDDLYGNEEEVDLTGMVWDDDDSLMLQNDHEYIQLLLNREICFENEVAYDTVEMSLKAARFDAIQWILEKRSSFGFSLKTAYVAVTYFDRFFMHRIIENMKAKPWAVHLLSLACLSLAAKMEENKVLFLSSFQLEYQFSRETMQRMELLVLSTLEWRMSSITPFHYLTFFASMFQYNDINDFILKASLLVLASTKEINLAQYRPSVIAVAAILAAMDRRLTHNAVESKMSLMSLYGSWDTDHVFFCYNLMIHLSHKEKPKEQENLLDPNGTIHYATSSSKKRRLQ